ncbi:hypothetical protein ONZ45_g18045 [Pleurotus djamor]|nr:hypothetical protein ONZ45_g18045 [Pleurotus djamor]
MFRDLQFPILETLVLDARWYSPVVAHFPFAPEIDVGVVPPLRHVKLSLCSFNINIPFLSHLRSLVIHHQATALVLPMHEVLSALTMMKHLESLELVSILGFFKIHDIPRHFLVELPELRALRLVSENPLVLTMLQHLSCPSLLSVVVTSGPPLHGGVPSSVLAAEISTAFYSLIPGSLFSWQIKANITLHRWSSVHTVSILPSPTSPPSTLELKGRTDDAIAMMLPTYHGQPGPLTFLRALDGTLVNQDRWKTADVGVLRSFLWTLDVEELQINDVEALIAIISDAPADPHPGIILPSLKHLDIEHLGRLTYSRRKLGKLKRALACRSAVNGGVLEVLRFRHPLGEDSLVKFRSVAQKLEYIDASQASQEL